MSAASPEAVPGPASAASPEAVPEAASAAVLVHGAFQ
jgi:hypothetical protein